MPLPQTLDGWLGHIDRVHSQSIALGLDRVARVRDAMGIANRAPVITVGGTNGKGSTCAMLESILRCAGYRTGLYTSPHLLDYNERVRVDAVSASDAVLCDAFEAVELARGGVPLTYFEFGTLAAWKILAEAQLDVLILEVGLGGRLDAVNAFEPDCAIVTSIDIDHTQFLGDTRESIGREKAGIFRAGRPAIVGDPMPPDSLVEYARQIGALLQVSGREFGFAGDRQQWGFWRYDAGSLVKRAGLAYPALRGANQLLNASSAIAALENLRDRLPVSMGDLRLGLITIELPGRFQVLPGRPAVVLDVAHNPQAAAVLGENLSNMGYFPETWAVFGMLRDKDIAGVVGHLRNRVDHWLCATLDGPRAATAGQLAQIVRDAQPEGDIRSFESAAEAYVAAQDLANENDRIVVFGSFLTVADAMRVRQSKQRPH
jgi:dihydrofolate synthase/folylpolyglutamate synthase